MEAAVEEYARAIELDPAYWYAYNNRGLALWAMGRREEAIRDYEMVKRLMESGALPPEPRPS